jgi:hypothetical protein
VCGQFVSVNTKIIQLIIVWCLPLDSIGTMEQIEAFRMMLFGEVRYEKCVFCGAAAESSDSPVCSLHAAQVR